MRFLMILRQITKDEREFGDNKIRCSIVVSISACHAEDPGSIPGGGVFAAPGPPRIIEDQETEQHIRTLAITASIGFLLRHERRARAHCHNVAHPGLQSR